MTSQSLAEQARAVYDAYRTHEYERVAEAFADDAELVNVATGDRFRGPEGYLQLARGWAGAFPDLQVEIDHLAADEESAVVEYTFRGTHTGPLVGGSGYVPPTWTQVELRLCDVLHLRDGRVTRLDSYFDATTMLRQMGIVSGSPLHAADRRATLGLFATEVDVCSQQRSRAIVQRFLEEVVNQRNPAAAAATCAPELVWNAGSIGEARDLRTFQRALAALLASFPDLQVELLDTIAEEDRVAVRATLRGTHLGAFRGIAPTGKRVTSTGLTSYRLDEGRIVEQWWQHDLLDVLRQLDAVPAMARGA